MTELRKIQKPMIEMRKTLKYRDLHENGLV